jgi:hypothetical protein
MCNADAQPLHILAPKQQGQGIWILNDSRHFTSDRSYLINTPKFFWEVSQGMKFLPVFCQVSMQASTFLTLTSFKSLFERSVT